MSLRNLFKEINFVKHTIMQIYTHQNEKNELTDDSETCHKSVEIFKGCGCHCSLQSQERA